MDIATNEAETVVGEIFALFGERGAERYGERVTQLDHALQCAELARREGAPATLIAAALLHDYGHLIESRGQMAERDGLDGEHEAIGALALSSWFGPEVTQPIALHVAAKRWLCAREPSYFEALSAASKLSLELQGGPFGPEDADRFLTRPYAAEAIRLRRWDDFGKKLETDEILTLGNFVNVLTGALILPRQAGEGDRKAVEGAGLTPPPLGGGGPLPGGGGPAPLPTYGRIPPASQGEISE